MVIHLSATIEAAGVGGIHERMAGGRGKRQIALPSFSLLCNGHQGAKVCRCRCRIRAQITKHPLSSQFLEKMAESGPPPLQMSRFLCVGGKGIGSRPEKKNEAKDMSYPC